MNALIATPKRLSNVLNAMGQESGLWDFISATAKNAPERESTLVLSAAGQASLRTDPHGCDRVGDVTRGPQRRSVGSRAICCWPTVDLEQAISAMFLKGICERHF
jgi:hypothetical protein